MSIKILMPALSPTMTEGILQKWLIKVGDKVKIIKGDDTESVFIIEAFDPDTREYIVVKEGTQNFKEEDAEVEMEVESGVESGTPP